MISNLKCYIVSPEPCAERSEVLFQSLLHTVSDAETSSASQ